MLLNRYRNVTGGYRNVERWDRFWTGNLEIGT